MCKARKKNNFVFLYKYLPFLLLDTGRLSVCALSKTCISCNDLWDV